MTDAEYDARMYIENDATEGERNGEAERLAAAVKPRGSVNGRIRGTKTRRITAKMRSFASLVAQGKSGREAYRTAYQVEEGKEHRVIPGRVGLMRDARVAALCGDVWERVSQNIVDDNIAARRFVMEQFKHHADNDKRDADKLKALEMMGRAIGMFTDKVESKVETISTEQLKAELESSLSLLGNVVPIRRESA
jgi:hypothetical protein